MKKVLVVEDRKEFMVAARSFFTTQQDVEVMFASSYEEARNLLESATFDVALIDVFMPSSALARIEAIKLLDLSTDDIINKSAGGDYDTFLNSVRAIMEDTEEAPVGLLLYKVAKISGIERVTLVTSLWHHSTKFEAVYRYLVVRGGRFYEGVEGSDRKAKPDTQKNCPEFWAKAYER